METRRTSKWVEHGFGRSRGISAELRLRRWGPGAGLVAVLLSTAWGSGQDEGPIDFGREVQPILAEHCYACHGPDEKARKAKLRLDRREDALALRKGDAPIVPGDPGASELVSRIHSGDGDEVMPPPDFRKPLSDAKKEILSRWIAQGAAYETHWSFAPLVKPPTPEHARGREIDYFVEGSLARRELEPAPAARPATWLRRVTLDLTGLPPTIDALEDFLADPSPAAHEAVVERLLQGADYAEHMAAIWLDHARYADSNGFQFDNTRTMWPWRDWVIDAFRANMRFDRFVTEQLAGDLLPDATRAQKIATGFNRNHGFTVEGGVIEEEYRVMYINDKTTTAGTLFLGLTLECARCHDHKYDPVSMREYYQLYAFFNSNAEGGVGQKGKPIAPAIEVDGGHVMVMEEQPRETRVLEAGQFDRPAGVVHPDTPAVLPAFGDRPRNRLGLAQWLTSEENPLLARVTVNRIWQQFFGTGLVKTADNLGVQGERPVHPELLDWLAADFREHGWDLHHLIRQIVLSATYRQDSRQRPEIEDPENRLLARGPSFRLRAETIRDQALAVSGLLTRTVGGPSVKPYQPPGIWEDLNASASHLEVYRQDEGEALYRKSMYTFWRRAAMHPAMAVFDAPNRDVCTVQRAATNTPLQALALLHDPTYLEAARKLAEVVLADGERDPIVSAMRRLLSRNPTGPELQRLRRLERDRHARYAADPEAVGKLLAVGDSPVDGSADRTRLAAMADVCLVLLNLSETLTRK